MAKTKPTAKPKNGPRMSTAKSGYGITWLVWFRFADDDWFKDGKATDLIVDALAGTALWKELDVIGRDNKLGTPRGSADATKRAIATGERDTFTLVHGSPRAAIYTDETDAWFTIDITPGYLNLGGGARDGALERIGPAALTDMIDLILRLRNAWKSNGHLDYATAFPTASGGFEYPRVDPPRTADRPLSSIVDIVDPTFDAYDDEDTRIPESRAIAKAKSPKGVTRSENDGVVVLRWIDDPRERAAVAKAAGRHAAWIVDVIETEAPDDDW